MDVFCRVLGVPLWNTNFYVTSYTELKRVVRGTLYQQKMVSTQDIDLWDYNYMIYSALSSLPLNRLPLRTSDIDSSLFRHHLLKSVKSVMEKSVFCEYNICC